MIFRKKSFTLMELLLVSVLISVISIVIFKTLINGLKLWGRAQQLSNESQVVYFLEKITDDIRSVIVMGGFNFKGTESKLSFPALVITKADAKSSRFNEGMISQIGAVEYFYDFSKHAIFRRQANYSQALKNQWPAYELQVVSGIKEVVFRYDISSERRAVLKSQISEGYPRGIVVEIKFVDDSGPHQIKRYIPLIVGV